MHTADERTDNDDGDDNGGLKGFTHAWNDKPVIIMILDMEARSKQEFIENQQCLSPMRLLRARSRFEISREETDDQFRLINISDRQTRNG